MGFNIETSVPILTVFIQGLLSFFSPCVLPLVPLYVSYLAGGAKTVEEDGTIRYRQGRVLVNTVFFVLGISFTFFILGLGFNALGRFFSDNRIWFARISGIIMILFGVYQLGVFGQSKVLGKEHRLLFRLVAWRGALFRRAARLYHQLCLDARVGPTGQRSADGRLLRIHGQRLRAHRRLYHRVYPAVSGRGPVHRNGAQFLQKAPQRGQIHG